MLFQLFRWIVVSGSRAGLIAVFRDGLPAVLFSLLLLATGCAHEQRDPNNPETVYKEAEEALKDERFLIAIDKLRDLKNRFPYSRRAVDAELMTADAYFAQESFLEAESAYEIFRELHPTHPKAEYVQFRIGMSYFNMIPENPAQDLSAAYRAIESFEMLLNRFPASEYAPQAREHIQNARRKLAGREIYIADFYYDRRHYLSASYRYSALLKDFGDLGMNDQALFRLGECYYNTRMYENARSALQRLLKEYPESSYKGGAISLMQSLPMIEFKSPR